MVVCVALHAPWSLLTIEQSNLESNNMFHSSGQEGSVWRWACLGGAQACTVLPRIGCES